MTATPALTPGPAAVPAGTAACCRGMAWPCAAGVVLTCFPRRPLGQGDLQQRGQPVALLGGRGRLPLALLAALAPAAAAAGRGTALPARGVCAGGMSRRVMPKERRVSRMTQSAAATGGGGKPPAAGGGVRACGPGAPKPVGGRGAGPSGRLPGVPARAALARQVTRLRGCLLLSAGALLEVAGFSLRQSVVEDESVALLGFEVEHPLLPRAVFAHTAELAVRRRWLVVRTGAGHDISSSCAPAPGTHPHTNNTGTRRGGTSGGGG